MIEEVWISSVRSNTALFNKLGIREKHYGLDWAPPKFELNPPSDDLLRRMWRVGSGKKIAREEFVEAAYVFNNKHWMMVGDLFSVCGFFAVKGKFAELLQNFDLGGTELVEFPIYEADKTTRLPGPFYFLNFGTVKYTFVPGESRNVRPLLFDKDTGLQVWKAGITAEDGDITVLESSLTGPDLWIEAQLHGKIFMSGRLHEAILDAKINIDFWFSKARIVGTNLEAGL